MQVDDETLKNIGQGVGTGMTLAGLAAFGHWLWKLVWIPGRTRRLEMDRVVLFTSIVALLDERIETVRRPSTKKNLVDARKVILDHLAKIGGKR